MQKKFIYFSKIIPQIYFITATDTGVGKTFITVELGKYFQSLGYTVGVFKPFSSGGREDAVFLKEALELEDDLDVINPVWFEEPLAPYSATVGLGFAPALSLLRTKYDILRTKYDILLVEGIGGVLVPLWKDYYVADLIKEFGLPALLVARAGLGTLNHTLLSLEALQHRQISIEGIILNGYQGVDLAEKSNKEVLTRLTTVPVLAEVPLR